MLGVTLGSKNLSPWGGTFEPSAHQFPTAVSLRRSPRTPSRVFDKDRRTELKVEKHLAPQPRQLLLTPRGPSYWLVQGRRWVPAPPRPHPAHRNAAAARALRQDAHASALRPGAAPGDAAPGGGRSGRQLAEWGAAGEGPARGAGPPGRVPRLPGARERRAGPPSLPGKRWPPRPPGGFPPPRLRVTLLQ